MVGPLLGGIEVGGTKTIALVARDGRIVERVRIATGDPAATLAAAAAALDRWGPVAAIGIASFGPVGLDPARADFGHITDTPKPGWSGVDVRGAFARFGVPIGFDTDVAGAALAEGRWGAARGTADHVYLTIGTGIGAGIVAGGRSVHGRVHPEVGHLRVRRRAGDAFAGVCPFHGDCLEGLASGPAIAARTGIAADALPPDHRVWTDVAGEIAELMAALILTVSPDRIVVGGGVGAGQPHLLPMIRTRTAALLGNYLPAFAVLDGVIVAPGLGDDAGPLGAVALAEDALAAV